MLKKYGWSPPRKGVVGGLLSVDQSRKVLASLFSVKIILYDGLPNLTEFADPPPAPVDISDLSIEDVETEMEPVVPAENPPTTLMEWAVLILNTPHPTLKVEFSSSRNITSR